MMNNLKIIFIKNKDIGKKKEVIDAVYDAKAYEELNQKTVGDKVNVEIGTNIDEYSQPVVLEGTLKAKGDLLGYLNATNDKVGDVCTVSVGNLDVVIANSGESFITLNRSEERRV